MEPSQLVRGMDVDIGMGLGDDLGGFEGFDAMFAEHNNTTDFFKFCALEDTQQQDTTNSLALQKPTSPVGLFVQQHKGNDFAQESWNMEDQEQIQAWPPLKSEPTHRVSLNMPLQSGGKPRARKRHDEDEALEWKESVFPFIKRRSSAASETTNTSPVPSPERLNEKSHSFGVTATAAGGWAPSAPQQQGLATRGVQVHQQQGERMASPPGGAIKVNTDVTNGTMPPPRISVFMSSSRRRDSNNGCGSTRASPTPRPSTSMVTTPSLPGSYGPSCHYQLEPTMDRTASAQAQRLKDVRISMRDRSLADKYVVEHTPAIVAMGSPHNPNSTLALLLGDDDHDDDFVATMAAPTLRRASSVGALTIAGNGDITSTSPVLSSTGRIIQSCELSDRVGDGGRRRNLVCKVFSSGGSPLTGPRSAGR